jgi:HlyD family secretion protein
VFVLVVVWEGDQVLQVPASALFRQEGGWATYVIEGGRARLRMVGIGHQSSHAAEILGGLGEGSRVVRHPTDRIADGVPVRITQR